jgi:hypothetical protein
MTGGKNKSVVIAMLLAFSPTFFAEIAHAEIVYSNFSSSDLGNLAWSITGEGSSQGYQSVATGFSSSVDYSLDSISIALDGASSCSSFDCSSDLLSVSLWTSTGNDLGSELGGWLINQPMNGVNELSVSGVNLVAGHDYFLKLQTLGAATVSLGWVLNTQNVSAPLLFDHNASLCFGCFPVATTGIGGAFELVGTVAPVPEPGSYALMLSGLGVIAWRLRRKYSNNTNALAAARSFMGGSAIGAWHRETLP